MAKKTKNKAIPLGIIIVSVLMVLFGLSEVMTGFTHNFFGIVIATGIESTDVAIILGTLYVVGGLLILTMKQRSAVLALACLAIVIFGRIGIVMGGCYPINTSTQIIAIILGTAIAIIFAIYVGLKWNEFEK